MDKKKKVVRCDKCWREFEIEDNEEWGYCPFCENDQVEATNCNLEEDWGGVVMEEKKRFEYYLAQNQLHDKTNDELYCFGIEQDKTRLVNFLNLMNEDWWTLYIRNKELREENQKLKQQLHELPKKIVGEIKLQLLNHYMNILKIMNIFQIHYIVKRLRLF